MKNNILSLLLFLCLYSTSFLTSALELEDVIYKNDGTILRGTLIEQDFKNKRYKIQLSGGSVFAVKQEEISKISREVPLHADIPKEQHFDPVTHQAQASPYSNGLGPLSTNNTFFIGPFSHRRSQPLNQNSFFNSSYNLSLNEVFRGVQFGFQHIVNKNFAMLYTLERAELREIVIENETTNEDIYAHEPSEDMTFLGKKVMAILSTNLYKNWRFFAGLGVYHNDYEQDSGDESLYGTRANLGMGYSWTNIQWMIRAGGDISNNEKDIDYSLLDLSLTLGVNF